MANEAISLAFILKNRWNKKLSFTRNKTWLFNEWKIYVWGLKLI